jgi:hypothetical protein
MRVRPAARFVTFHVRHHHLLGRASTSPRSRMRGGGRVAEVGSWVSLVAAPILAQRLGIHQARAARVGYVWLVY